MSKRKFITLEGVDGVGKSTVLKNFGTKCPTFRLFKSPPDELKPCRAFYDDPETPVWTRFLFYLSANLYMSRSIRDAIITTEALCDRFVLSTFAYHNVMAKEREISPRFFELFSIAGGLMPDIHILLIANQAARKSRLSKRPCAQNTYRDKDMGFTSQVQKEFVRLVRKHDLPAAVIDTSNMGEEEVTNIVTKLIHNVTGCLI